MDTPISHTVKNDFLTDLSSFINPKCISKKVIRKTVGIEKIAVLIPVYRPRYYVLQLIKYLIKWYPGIYLVIIDDSTPQTGDNLRTLDKIKILEANYSTLKYLRTPQNLLKAGALNIGIQYLQTLPIPFQVVFTLDDDVRINSDTITYMSQALYSGKKVGAVCSLALVSNKNINLLTRLQSLEYHNFNITKIADNGFIKGPLVMQGMLTGFRMSALKTVKGFIEGHLIEDYDITVRLKNKGWKVKIVKNAFAWTTVPENLKDLWKQRIRWSLGGLQVVRRFWTHIPSIFQDFIGHIMFVFLLLIIILSFVLQKSEFYNLQLIQGLFIVSLINGSISILFSIVTLANYPKIDWIDFILKAILLPEILYSTLLSIVLLGSYAFYACHTVTRNLIFKTKYFSFISTIILQLFRKAGYTFTWGTRKV